MHYSEAEQFLVKAAGIGIKPGLERIRSLLDYLGNPQHRLRFIHIAGTNGKGSLGSYCNAILARAGCKTGWFSTPHLSRRSESLRITCGAAGYENLLADEKNGEISENQLAEYVSIMAGISDQMDIEGQGRPSEFELMTALALSYFADQKVDFVIWETGMGGLLDATNVIDQAEVCLITALGYDHQSWLGTSIEKIAEHKAGIIKTGSQVYLYNPYDALDDSAEAARALAVVRKKCEQLGCQLKLVSAADFSMVDLSLKGQSFTCGQLTGTMRLKQLGLYQPQLALMAALACRYLLKRQKQSDLIISQAISYGLSTALWPARLEVCAQSEDRLNAILLDGAHNPQGCSQLARTLACLLKGQKINFLTGVLADKNTKDMYTGIFRAKDYQTGVIICTRPVSNRAMPAVELAGLIASITGRKVCRLPSGPHCGYNDSDLVFYDDNPLAAAEYAVRATFDSAGSLCAFGSLYLAGAIRDYLRQSSIG